MTDRSKAFKAHLLFGFLLSGLMSLMVSGISTARAIGFASVADAPSDFADLWLQAWLASWAVAFPAVLLVAPIVRKIVGRIYPP